MLLSLDVKSLFTNILVNLDCKSIDRRDHSIITNCSIPVDDIKKCIQFLYNNTYFTFKNKYYQQIFGTPMGTPISPLFTDIVMDDLEKTCLDSLKNKYNCTLLFAFSKRKLCNGENFRIKDFDEFRCF